MTDPVAIDSAEFRRTLGHFPTGVTVVTGVGADGPVGMAIGSFTSVSLDPPMVGFLPTQSSSTWAVIKESGSFCVNILAAEQLELCGVMASRIETKFDGVDWAPAASGSPVLPGVLAYIDCTIDAVHAAGDHDVVIGKVDRLEVLNEEALPMVFFKGQYGTFG